MKKIILAILMALSINTIVQAQDYNNDCNNNYNYPSTGDRTVTPAPDTATTLFLLGAALTGMELFRRKFATAKKTEA